MSTIYQFPYDSPIRYLPLVHILPYDLLMRCPTLRNLPRSMGAVNTPEWGTVIESDAFCNEIMDTVASLVFPHFGFGGWKEHYTGWFPVWRLSYALPLWAKGVERVRGWGVQALFELPPDFEIPFFDPEDIPAFYESGEGQREFAEWKERRKRKSRRQKQNKNKNGGRNRANGCAHHFYSLSIFSLYKPAKTGYTVINPRLLGGGVLALGAARFASRFFFGALLSFWEKDCSISINDPAMLPEFFLHKDFYNCLFK